MAERTVGVDPVVISTTIPSAGQVAVLTEIRDDTLYGSFRDSDAGRDIPGPDEGVLMDADEDMGMVGQEGPIFAQPVASFLRPGRSGT
jgi:hypothetical protein